MNKIDPKELTMQPMKEISDGWLLITVGNEKEGYNTMTACWGHVGSIWGFGNGKPSAIVYIRPQRYTKEWMDRFDTYTISFFPNEYKKDLVYLGSHSGRDGDKVAHTSLTPIFKEDHVTFEQASLVLKCRKLYAQPLVEEGFIDPSIVKDHYPQKDFHTMYIGEIEEVFKKSV